ncbi:MAG: hypothetical protein ACTSPW_18615 [Promethearchaeota archaeon]
MSEIKDKKQVYNAKIQSIEDDKYKYTLDFTTSSAISRVNIKFLAVYIPIFWLAGLWPVTYWYSYLQNEGNWTGTILMIPVAIFSMYYLFLFALVFYCKLFLILVNLIHKPKEGIFLAEIGDTDFEFWCLRTELKKIAVWFLNNSPLPWVDALAFRWFGIKMDFTNHLNDAWVDIEYIKFGRRSMIGQGAVVMSSMVVGKYLIIKRVVLDDYSIIGGQSTVAPGTYIGRETLLAACSTTTYNQVLEPGWVYFGIPAIKLKENKYAEERRDIIIKKDVDEEMKMHVKHDVNIDEDKMHLIVKEEDEGDNE